MPEKADREQTTEDLQKAGRFGGLRWLLWLPSINDRNRHSAGGAEECRVFHASCGVVEVRHCGNELAPQGHELWRTSPGQGNCSEAEPIAVMVAFLSAGHRTEVRKGSQLEASDGA